MRLDQIPPAGMLLLSLDSVASLLQLDGSQQCSMGQRAHSLVLIVPKKAEAPPAPVKAAQKQSMTSGIELGPSM